MNIVQILDQICQCPTVSIDKFIKDIMPMLIGSIQPLLDLMDNKLSDDRFAILFDLMDKDKRVSVSSD